MMVDGLQLDQGIAREPQPKLIFVSPSRHYPLGATMTPRERGELLAFAERVGAWIIEDDYDSEFRYRGASVPAMQSMDDGERVILLGTFSKSLLPSFRLGFMVVPPRLAREFASSKGVIDRHPPLVEQKTLANFMATGQFVAHLRRMRKLYGARHDALLENLRLHAAHWLDVSQADTGMHLVGFLPPDVEDCSLCESASRVGLAPRPLSIYYLEAPRRSALLLGFASTSIERIRWGVPRLTALYERCRRGR